MASVERFEVWRQREAMVALAADPRFLSTAEGAAFLEQLSVKFAPVLMKYASEAGFRMERDEIVNLIVTNLLSLRWKDQPLAAKVATVESPWGYIFESAKNWCARERGVRSWSGIDIELVPQTASEPDQSLTPIQEVIELTFSELAVRTDPQLHEELLQLLNWLALNPLQRLSYEREEKIAAQQVAPSFSAEQISAVMNICWGGRPRQAQTSLMGQYLLDPTFKPSTSPSHARALSFYKNAMRAGAASLLADWK